jgi:UrcA family protein
MMKTLRGVLSLILAIPVSALIGSGFAYAEDTEVSEPASDTIEHIVAMGEASGFEGKSVTVPCADLNLKNEQGALTLYRRLQRASESVCDVRDFYYTRSLQVRRDARECYYKTLTAAVESANSDKLTSIHHEKELSEMLAAKVE